MYCAPLRNAEGPSHEREREEWVRRLKARQAEREATSGAAFRAAPEPSPPSPRRSPLPELSGDAALMGLILFLLSDRTKSDGILLCILVYLLLN